MTRSRQRYCSSRSPDVKRIDGTTARHGCGLCRFGPRNRPTPCVRPTASSRLGGVAARHRGAAWRRVAPIEPARPDGGQLEARRLPRFPSPRAREETADRRARRPRRQRRTRALSRRRREPSQPSARARTMARRRGVGVSSVEVAAAGARLETASAASRAGDVARAVRESRPSLARFVSRSL